MEEPLDQPYCDLCEEVGHKFSNCPDRDDEEEFETGEEPPTEVEDHYAEDDAYEVIDEHTLWMGGELV